MAVGKVPRREGFAGALPGVEMVMVESALTADAVVLRGLWLTIR
jgi:hypothetical protein